MGEIMSHAIGIDLGTTNSVVAVMLDGEVTVVPNDKGEMLIPSVISFDASDAAVVGSGAKSRIITHGPRTVYSAKRLIGRKAFSGEVKKARQRMPYKLVDGANDSVLIQIGERTFTVPEVSALVLKQLKQMAEAFLGQPVKDAVITVPAYFNDGQRAATASAGQIAGLNVIRIINEPTAAALAYGLGKKLDKKVAIYDLGGGTFDVSILHVMDDVFEVVSTAGDTFLGGDDFDDRIVDFLIKRFKEQFKVDPSEDKVAMQRLRLAGEQAKKELSEQQETRIRTLVMESNGQKLAVEASLTRAQFAQLCFDLVQRTFQVCDEALQNGRMTVSDIDEVVLVGGSTRMPMVRDMVEKYFFKKPNASINPDQVVAVGAAVQAAALVGEGKESLLLDVTSQSLGVATVGSIMEVLIPRNSSVPVEQRKVFTTGRDNQDSVRIKVYQGESRNTEENELLGECILEGIPPSPRGVPKIDVTFEIDADGMVNVAARDIQTGHESKVRLEISGGMSSDQIAAAQESTMDIAVSSA